MPRLASIPSYRHHRQSGQAVVTLPDGLGHRRDVLLGKYGTAASRAEYARVIAEWEANNRRLPAPAVITDLTINEVAVRYLQWAKEHYRDADGNQSGELDNVTLAVQPLRQLYGHTVARDFGPLALRSVRDALVKSGLSRRVVNFLISRIKRVIKWAVSYELIPASVHEALRTVNGLQRGRSEARETAPIGPAPEAQVKETLPHLPTPVRAMVELQLLTGMRAGEVTVMRAIDLTMTGAVWTYRPESHKNKHRGLDRVIYLGPQAQGIIKPFLTTNLEGYLFSPRAYVEELHRRRAEGRKTKRTPSEAMRRRKAKPKRAPGERYNRRSYYYAVLRACKKANVPGWSPLQLRHAAATSIRARYGLEAAKAILGHSRVETAEIYAARDLGRAKEIMREIG
jgi:integrase